MYFFLNKKHTNTGDYMNNSLWLNSIKLKEYKSLKENIKVDVLIIGGGMTGISTAYHLINKNKRIALVDKNKILSGITSKTTGKLTYLQETIYTKLKKIIMKKLLNSI